jgi:hypothetical protein
MMQDVRFGDLRLAPGGGAFDGHACSWLGTAAASSQVPWRRLRLLFDRDGRYQEDKGGAQRRSLPADPRGTV